MLPFVGGTSSTPRPRCQRSGALARVTLVSFFLSVCFLLSLFFFNKKPHGRLIKQLWSGGDTIFGLQGGSGDRDPQVRISSPCCISNHHEMTDVRFSRTCRLVECLARNHESRRDSRISQPTKTVTDLSAFLGLSINIDSGP